jgi:hypothetical protein
VLGVKEHAPIPFFIVFIFKFTFESFKECGGVSQGVELDSFEGKLNDEHIDGVIPTSCTPTPCTKETKKGNKIWGPKNQIHMCTHKQIGRIKM